MNCNSKSKRTNWCKTPLIITPTSSGCVSSYKGASANLVPRYSSIILFTDQVKRSWIRVRRSSFSNMFCNSFLPTALAVAAAWCNSDTTIITNIVMLIIRHFIPIPDLSYRKCIFVVITLILNKKYII